MNARVLCFASAKGGSGKTLLAATIGTFIANIGKRVLIVDADSATNGISLFYLPELGSFRATARAHGKGICGLFDPPQPSASFTPVNLGDSLDLLPATFSSIDTDRVSLEHFSQNLIGAINQHRGNYDYILIDAEAGTDANAAAAMSRQVSDEVVIVSEFDPISAAGVERMKALLRADLTYDRTWILLNKMLPEFVSSFTSFFEVARYLSPIPWDPDVVRAYSRRTLALDLARGNEHTRAIYRSLRSLDTIGLREALEDWAAARAEDLRYPLQAEFEDVERELRGVFLAQHQLRLKARRVDLLLQLAGFMVTATAVTALALQIDQDLIRMVTTRLDASSWRLVLTGLAIVGGLMTPVILNWLKPAVDRTFEESQLERKERQLRDRLERIEHLRNSDPETLLSTSSLTRAGRKGDGRRNRIE